MRFKLPKLLAAVLGMMFFAFYAQAAIPQDRDVGPDKIFAKAKASDSDQAYQFSVVAHESAPAWIRNKFVDNPLPRQNERQRPAIWNCRINHNYPFQIPGKAGPPLIRHVLLE